MQELTLIKLGGSVITEKSQPYTPRKDVIRRLLQEIKRANMPVIAAHGQGSFAHTSASKGYVSPLEVAKVSYDVMQLNTIVIQEAMSIDLPAILMRPQALFLANKGNIIKSDMSLMLRALTQGFTPILCGDIVFDTEWKTIIFSGERILFELAKYLHHEGVAIRQVIFVGETNGFYDASGKTIHKITEKNWSECKQFIQKTKVHDVTGGIAHKVEEALLLAKQGVVTDIINGKRENQLYKSLQGIVQEGTHIS